MKTYKAEITAWDITFAVKKASRFCMIAEALRRTYPALARIEVDTATIVFTDRDCDTRYTFLTPPDAQMAILDFDHGNEVKPFILDLRKPVVERRQRAAMLPSGKPRKKVVGRRGNTLRRTLEMKQAIGRMRGFGLKMIGKGLGEKKV
jgi:hypothetical protein